MRGGGNYNEYDDRYGWVDGNDQRVSADDDYGRYYGDEYGSSRRPRSTDSIDTDTYDSRGRGRSYDRRDRPGRLEERTYDNDDVYTDMAPRRRHRRAASLDELEHDRRGRGHYVRSGSTPAHDGSRYRGRERSRTREPINESTHIINNNYPPPSAATNSVPYPARMPGQADHYAARNLLPGYTAYPAEAGYPTPAQYFPEHAYPSHNTSRLGYPVADIGGMNQRPVQIEDERPSGRPGARYLRPDGTIGQYDEYGRPTQEVVGRRPLRMEIDGREIRAETGKQGALLIMENDQMPSDIRKGKTRRSAALVRDKHGNKIIRKREKTNAAAFRAGFSQGINSNIIGVEDGGFTGVLGRERQIAELQRKLDKLKAK